MVIMRSSYDQDERVYNLNDIAKSTIEQIINKIITRLIAVDY